MIDFVKILLCYINPDDLLNNPLVEFEGKYNRATGEIYSFPLVAKYHSLTFIIQSKNRILLLGSLHIYWNLINDRGKQNYNDFTFLDLVSVILDLQEKFNIDLFSAFIQNIEFGVNINTTVSPDKFLKSLINHKGKVFNTEKEKGKYYLQCEHQRYIVKVYNKGLQNNLQQNILRFEGKIKKMREIETTGIKTLADLLDIDKLMQLEPILKTFYEDILLYDKSINTGKLNAKERDILNYGSNPNNWDDLKETGKDNFYKKRNRFNEILIKCNGNFLKETTGKLITEKWSELSKVDDKTLQKLPNFQNSNITGITQLSKQETLQELPNLQNKEITVINHLSIGLIPSLSSSDEIERKCLFCGKDISGKKKVAKYCSKKCRNDYTNPKLTYYNNLINRIQNIEKNPTFFNTVEYLKESDRQILEQPNSIFNNQINRSQ